MKHIGENKNIFKQLALVGLSALSFAAAGFAAFSWLAPTQETVLAASSNSTTITLNASNVPALNYYPYTPIPSDTYTSGHFTVGSWTWNDNMATSYSSSVHCSLRNNQEGYIANVTPLTGFDYLSVNCRATTGTAICNIWASNTYSTAPYTYYTKIASETMSTSDADVTPTISASYKFFAVHVAVSSNSYRNNRLLINTLTLAKSYPLTGIAISGADTIGLADEGKPYEYAVIATYSNGATKDITKAATLTTPLINTMKLGLQTLSVSYKGFTASKTVRVTNVNAVVSKTIPVATYTDATFHNEDSISTGALLNGKTLSFNPDSDATTGAWDITCTAATTGNEYNAFLSSGVWQLGSEEAPYRTFTLTSRDIWVNMVRSYNKNHSTKIYLYDTSYYGATDNGGTNGYLPVFVDGNGKVLRPDETGSSLSLTLIIVAVSGGVTLLGIAGLYFFSKAKNKRMSENRRP